MQISVSEDRLRQIVRDAVKEAIAEERMTFLRDFAPEVSDEEMQEVEALYGEPKKSKVRVDADKWLGD